MAGRDAGRDRGGAQVIRDPYINRLNGIHHVAGALGFQTPRMLTPRGVVPNMPPPDVFILGDSASACGTANENEKDVTDAPRPFSRPVRNTLILKTQSIVVEESKPIVRMTAGFVNKKGVTELATN
ncbi:hypothetical protein PIB30_077067 [Stylosanthes scabra]|uniref:Uncharacterized protein n=1 Tax=Stylosanthes scabra TaxID=79078 RepID=A0ABU6SQV8_9FABA|nr:hypothetical protein [Stylosanthes scabra]